MVEPTEHAPAVEHVVLETPAIPISVPLSSAIPPGWELATQQIRPAKLAPPATQSGIKPTAPVMAAAGATLLVPLFTAIFTAVGHPIPTEILIALPTLCAFIGGWLHGDGRS